MGWQIIRGIHTPIGVSRELVLSGTKSGTPITEEARNGNANRMVRIRISSFFYQVGEL